MNPFVWIATLSLSVSLAPPAAIAQCSSSTPQRAAPLNDDTRPPDDIPLTLALAAPADAPRPSPASTRLRFDVTVADGLLARPEDGRLFVVLGTTERPEPRLLAGNAGRGALPMFARDVTGFAHGTTGTIDGEAAAFPIGDLAQLPPGEYSVQAVFDRNRDLKALNAPGNLYSEPRRARLDPSRGAVAIELARAIPAETLPADTEWIKYLKVPSPLLTAFHGRPMSLRAAVILPRDFDREADRRYPLRVHIGGYGSRFTDAAGMMADRSGFRRAWLADDAPRMVLLHLDGAGPLGDPYQVNSANHGPYGDAITRELIPHVERQFRGIGRPQSRVLDGGSTGGWVALALQVFYPDFFNGAWAFCPDSVDFRSFQLVNIYEDANAYVAADGTERPAARERTGAVRYTMRHECQMENVLGRGDSWSLSGGQWGAWNATYGPRGADGLPVPLWNPKTGAIDRTVVDHWRKYDLRLILERDWATLGPKLSGKLHIWVGEADDYFLNHAVHRLDDFLSKADPPYRGSIAYGPGRGHCWMGIDEREMMGQMEAAVAGSREAGVDPSRE